MDARIYYCPEHQKAWHYIEGGWEFISGKDLHLKGVQQRPCPDCVEKKRKG